MALKSFPIPHHVKSDKPANDSINILIAIKETQLAIERSYTSFRQAVDPLLIDCYIYEMNAQQKRFQYLLQCARRRGLTNLPTSNLSLDTTGEDRDRGRYLDTVYEAK